MTVDRVLRWIAVLFGGFAIATAVVVGLVFSPRPAPGGPQLVGIACIAVAAVVAVAKGIRALLDATDSPLPWTAAGSLVDGTPEETPDDDRVSGTDLRPVVDRAGSRARSARSVEAGLSAVRSPLRETLETALVRGGRDPAAVEEALASGSWTDDRVAAAVLDEGVTPPERSFAGRLRAWLFPERAVRDRTARAVGAVAVATDDALPPVVGQDVARPVPVATTTLDDERNGVGPEEDAAPTDGRSDHAARWDRVDREGSNR